MKVPLILGALSSTRACTYVGLLVPRLAALADEWDGIHRQGSCVHFMLPSERIHLCAVPLSFPPPPPLPFAVAVPPPPGRTVSRRAKHACCDNDYVCQALHVALLVCCSVQHTLGYSRAHRARERHGARGRLVDKILCLEVSKDHQTCHRQIGLRTVARDPALRQRRQGSSASAAGSKWRLRACGSAAGAGRGGHAPALRSPRSR
jgi:hypothetical protein